MEELTKQMAALVATFQTMAQNGQIGTAPQTIPTAEATNNHRLLESLSARIPKFTYEPEEDLTFENWWGRYENIVVKDGETLPEDSKTRLLLDKLDSKAYTLYANRILPKNPTEISFNDTTKTLKTLFKSTTSVFRKRQDFLRIEYDGTGIEQYTGKVLRGFTSSEFKIMSDEQVCIMIWISGLRGEAYQDIRLRALQLIESKPAITLLELEAEVKKLIDIKTDAKSMSGIKPQAEANAVHKSKKQPNKTKKPEKSQKKSPPSPCYRCNGNHWARDCEWKEAECHFCKKPGHLEKCCRAKQKDTTKTPKVKSIKVEAAKSVGINRIYKKVEINGHPISMLFDTGADVTLISRNHWTQLGKPKLQKPSITIKSANHQTIPILGSLNCNFILNGNNAQGVAYVTDTDTLLGTEWIKTDQSLWNHIQDPRMINAVSPKTPTSAEKLAASRDLLKREIQSEYNSILQPGLGKCTKGKATLELKQNEKPVFRKARPVPYATLPVVSAEIERLTNTGVITPIDHSEWAAPVVAVSKKDGQIRLCADFSTGLNDAIETNNHPLPTAEEIFAKLNGGVYFSQIDLAEAYLQCEIDDDAKKLLVINTHRGLFCYNYKIQQLSELKHRHLR
ncbi:hypothetical protein CAEBREN_16863 [Caenorhabditis brenneri]|uniref:Peptidase A2 domain-containing protein n=1 Tax=Caenorhabditis brenneri TaxID=135651 RepID=G0P4S5_CAEBE|nr:hypothetical protein CAEBREN_16863 [Caenorhabditis brenneri]